MLSTFQSEIPGYTRLPDSVIRGEVLQVVRRTSTSAWIGSPVVAPRRRSGSTIFAPPRRTARPRACPSKIFCVPTGAARTAAWRVIVGEAAPAERDALPRAAELVMEYLDQVSGIVAAAYLEEREHHVSERERSLRVLLDALVGGDALDDSHRATAERLGLPLAGDLVAFAIAIPGEGGRAHGRTAAGLRAVGALALTEGHRVVGLIAPRPAAAPALPAGTLRPARSRWSI